MVYIALLHEKMVFDMKLVHLGCFDQPAIGWENYDITPHILISKLPLLPILLHQIRLINKTRYEQHRTGIFKKVNYLDLRKKLVFNDNSVDAFFSSHVFEHLYHNDLELLLKEIYRALKPNGFVRTILPDLDKIIKLYNEQNPDFFIKSMFENYNSKNSKNMHKWMYTKFSFKHELIKAGFDERKIYFKNYKETNFKPFLDLDNRPENSFYIEAEK